MWDTTYFSAIQLIYFNFTSTVIIPLFMAGSFPSKNSNRFVPETNFMGLINHLRYWGNVIIPSAGLIAGFFYFVNNPEFVPNETPEAITQFHPVNMAATIIFLMVLIPFSFNGLFLYISRPWKPKIYRNIPLFVIILLNIISAITLFYLTPYLTDTLATVVISPTPISICLAIVGAATALQYLFNQVIDQMEQHVKEDDDD